VCVCDPDPLNLIKSVQTRSSIHIVSQTNKMQTSLTDFFAKKRPRGRPKIPKNKTPGPKQEEPAPPPPATPKQAKRKLGPSINWTNEPNRTKLESAVREWADPIRQSRWIVEHPKQRMKGFALDKEIPISTFRDHLKLFLEDNNHFLNMKSEGRPRKFIKKESDRTMIDHIRLMDRYNHGLDTKHIVNDFLRIMPPDTTPKQASNHWQYVRKTDGAGLLTARIKGQGTTKDRTASITPHHQAAWHVLVDQVFEESKLESEKYPHQDGKTTYAEVMEHFVFCVDEENEQANLGSDYLYGDKARKTHDRVKHDSRISVTTLRVGSAAGVKGPTIFLSAGKTVRAGYTSAYLKRCGAPAGSSIIPTPSAFMTDEAWDESALIIVKQLRKTPVVVDCPPEWPLIIFGDGFSSHVMTLKAQQTFTEYHAIFLKEFSQTSHANQAFDDHPATA
jgi:hypothetical protein